MISKLRNLILIIMGSLSIMLGLLPAVVSASCTSPATTQEAIQCGACNGSNINDAQCAGASTSATKSLDSTIANVVNIISVVGGIVAVVMIILGGFRYITSAGNDQAVASAKKTLMYAIIGLAIIALAQVIAKFTLHEATAPAKKSQSHQIWLA